MIRKLALTLGALAVVGFAVPMAADAETIVVKKSDRGHHYGWDRNREHRLGVFRPAFRPVRDHDRKTVIIHRGDRDRY